MHRLLASVSLAIAVAACFDLATRSAAQDSPIDQADALVKKDEAEIDQYLTEHPVRAGPLFEAAAALVALLGKFDAMIVDACEYDPQFPDWIDGTKGLHENTVAALGKSYEDAMRKHMQETPAANTFRDRSLCADEKRSREKAARELRNTFAGLRRDGY